jgi:putative methyltransferase (TIGR04325 family)
MNGALRLSLGALKKPVRRAIVGLLPPAAVALLKRRRYKRYRSFAEAAEHSPSVYDSETLTRFRVAKAKLNLSQIGAESLGQGYSLLLAAVGMTEHAKVSVCDFGGACGEWGYALQRDVTSKQCDLTVVETESLARACEADPFFDWARWTAELPEAFDIFFASGALQYVTDPYAVLEQAFKRAKNFVVLTRTTFAAQESFRVQRSALGNNGFGALIPEGFEPSTLVYYPHRAVSLQSVLELAASLKWKVKLQSDDPPNHDLGDDVFERGFVFARMPHP